MCALSPTAFRGKWLAREPGEDEANRVVAFTTTCDVADLGTTVALSAAELGTRHKLSNADAIIDATALAYEADLLTCGRHFENLPVVRYLPQGNRLTPSLSQPPNGAKHRTTTNPRTQ